MKTIRDLDITGKRVLIRVDLNVPMDETGRITDDDAVVMKRVVRNGGDYGKEK